MEQINPTDLPELASQLAERWGIEIDTGVEPMIERLKELLAIAAGDLLSRDPERLAQIMYRLDVKEELFRKAIVGGTEDEKARRLAEIIWQRELQRLEFRRKYRPNQQDPV